MEISKITSLDLESLTLSHNCVAFLVFPVPSLPSVYLLFTVGP